MTRASLLLASSLIASSTACRPRPADSAGDGAATAPSSSSVQATPPPASATASSAASDAGSGCFKFDAQGNGPKMTFEGIVHAGSASHPNGSMFPIHVLALDRAICLEGERDPVTEVQLLGDDKTLARIVDKRVRVGGETAEPQTAYHRRSVMLHVAGEPTVLGAAPKPPAPTPTPTPRPSSEKPPTGKPCGMSPSDWCPSPAGDPCGVHKNVKDCRADKRCKGMPYRGESFVACKDDGTGFASNCPTVGCISR